MKQRHTVCPERHVILALLDSSFCTDGTTVVKSQHVPWQKGPTHGTQWNGLRHCFLSLNSAKNVLQIHSDKELHHDHFQRKHTQGFPLKTLAFFPLYTSHFPQVPRDWVLSLTNLISIVTLPHTLRLMLLISYHFTLMFALKISLQCGLQQAGEDLVVS